MADTAFISAAQFTQVLEASRMLAVTTELDPLLDHIARACCSMLDCERASIFLYDRQANELWTKVALGSKEIRVPVNAGIVGHVFQANQLFHCRKPYDDPRFNPEPDRRTGFVTRNLLTAPMLDIARAPVGVIQAVNKRSDRGFTQADESIVQLLADQGGVAMQRFHLQQEVIQGLELRHEMGLAKKVQEAMIPTRPPEIDGIQCVGWTQSASITGGDCYDLWTLNDGRLGIFLGDASGHGIAPAMVVSQARTLVRAMCELQSDPRELLAIANARLAEDMGPGRFVTAFLGILSPDGLLHWASAGHGPILLQPDPDGPIEMLDATGPPLGVTSHFLGDEIPPVQLSIGGRLLVVSDGIFEAFDSNRTQFDIERVTTIMRENSGADLSALSNLIRDAVIGWQGKPEPLDDQTLVIARRCAITS